MKKSCLSLAFFLTACHLAPHYDTEFKNPVFYQLMEPHGKTVGYAYLTPTSIKFSELSNKDKIDYIGKCDLIENEQDRITLKCTGEWFDGSPYSSYFTYVIKGTLRFDPHRLHIVEYSYDKQEDFPRQASYRNYSTISPQDVESESD